MNQRISNTTKVCFIGAGNLATQLALALHAKGVRIVQVYSRTEESASALARQLAGEYSCAYTTQVSQLTSEADLYICALKDSVIESVLQQTNGQLQDKILVHTAGSISMSVLQDFARQTGVLYPMQTFTKVKQVDFTKVPFLLEGSSVQVIDLLDDIIGLLSKNVYHVSSEDRKRIHLAAVFVSNFANHTYTLGAELAKDSGLPFEVLLPLIDETAEKVHSVPPQQAQSGPAIRHDANVMAMHQQMLEGKPMMQKIYELMSDSIQETGQKTGQKTSTKNFV